MMKRVFVKVVVLCFMLQTAVVAFAQQVNSLYFLDNVPYQLEINPSLIPERDGYVGLPILGYGELTVGNSALSLKNVMYRPKGQKQLVTFLHPEYGDKDAFYKRLRTSTLINFDYKMSILSFGFRLKNDSYFSFGVSEHIEGGLGLPKEVYKLLLYGTPERYNNMYDWKPLSVTASAYTEVALGMAFQTNAHLQTGFKIKFLLGQGNATLYNSKLGLNAGLDKWNVVGESTLRMSAPLLVNDKFDGIVMPEKWTDYIKPSGYGAGLDFGITYTWDVGVRISAAITDLGFIYWNKNVKNATASVDFSFEGIEVEGSSLIENFSANGLLDSLKTGFLNSFDLNSTGSNKGYMSMTTGKLNVGLEYNFCEDKLGIGALSRTMYFNRRVYEEVTVAFKIKPVNWFNMNVSYSCLNGRSSIGAGLSLRGGPFLFFVAADYVPITYVSYTGDNGKKWGVPYDSRGFNLSGGIAIVWGKRDKDKDGVPDKLDMCPNTPKGVLVDSAGCPLDEDGDGVPDYLDQCQGTPTAARNYIDSLGCPIDSDGDGVFDYIDQCPNTPEAAYNYIDSLGCPLDSDGDGVFDYIDQCPNTPEAAYNYIDSLGCPLDSDGDGVFDYLDQCPNTLAGVNVDENGCPIDSDKDGVPDYLDECPNTPAEAIGFIDAKGCELDSDGDGIPDYKDKCPNVAGVAKTGGCPELTRDVKKLFTKALQGIQFATGKSIILKVSFPILNEIADVMLENPTWQLVIKGHTDNTGDPLKNLKLSDDRANSVKIYLMGRGVEPSRITAVGYGDTEPVADNKTAAGRKENRRVEFVVNFEQTVTEKVE